MRIGREKILPWLASRGLENLEFRELPDIGYVNHVYQIGQELILRVNKSVDDASDAYTESVAVPVAFSAGVNTPELLEFDDSKKILESVASLYRKADGETLGRCQVDQQELPNFYRQIGEQLAILHEGVTECADPHGFLDKPEMFDARSLLSSARSKMKVEAVSYDWISRWLDILEPALSNEVPCLFLHDDLHPFNTLVNFGPLRLSAILDWGDAGWGDSAIEFGTMPIWAVDWVLEGYEAMRGPTDETFHGRLLWHDIGAALDATIDEWDQSPEPWQPLTTSRWINFLRFLAHPKDPRWARWMPKKLV